MPKVRASHSPGFQSEVRSRVYTIGRGSVLKETATLAKIRLPLGVIKIIKETKTLIKSYPLVSGVRGKKSDEPF